MSKAEQQRKHAFRRSRERVEGKITQNDYVQIIKMIQTGKACFLERQSNRVTLWILVYRDEPVRVVYDKVRSQVVSFLPIEEEHFDKLEAWEEKRNVQNTMVQAVVPNSN